MELKNQLIATENITYTEMKCGAICIVGAENNIKFKDIVINNDNSDQIFLIRHIKEQSKFRPSIESIN